MCPGLLVDDALGLLSKAAGGVASGIGAAASALSLSGSSEQGQYLFRVVNDAELAVTLGTQGLVADPNNFGKELWFTIDDARWYANTNINQGMNRTIIQVQVSTATLSSGWKGSDIGHNFIHFENNVLPGVNQDIRAHGGVMTRDRYQAK